MLSRETAIYENSFPVEGGTYENAGHVSSQIKALLKRMKISKEVVRRAALVTYESEINICSYARSGKILLRVTPEHVTIEAIDEGQGIVDIELAMQEGYSTATDKIREMGFGAGMGWDFVTSRIFPISFVSPRRSAKAPISRWLLVSIKILMAFSLI